MKIQNIYLFLSIIFSVNIFAAEVAIDIESHGRNHTGTVSLFTGAKIYSVGDTLNLVVKLTLPQFIIDQINEYLRKNSNYLVRQIHKINNYNASCSENNIVMSLQLRLFYNEDHSFKTQNSIIVLNNGTNFLNEINKLELTLDETFSNNALATLYDNYMNSWVCTIQ